MKVLTLRQPWATLVAIGAKKIETRSWKTNYRGPLAIHAAKRIDKQILRLCFTEPFFDALAGAGIRLIAQHVFRGNVLPRGAIVAICTLRQVVEITERNASGLKDLELSFGDFTPGRYAWFLDDVEELVEPIPARGRQGLWLWAGSEEPEKVMLSKRRYHRPRWIPLVPGKAAYCLGTACGLSVREHALSLADSPSKLKPCKRCYP